MVEMATAMVTASKILIILLLSGCTGIYTPRLMGPAEEVNCTINRTNSSMYGQYECHVKGKYQLNEFGM